METKYVFVLLLALWAVMNLVWSIRLNHASNALLHINNNIINTLRGVLFKEIASTSGVKENEQASETKNAYAEKIEKLKKGAVYSGIIHIFNRHGKKERPVMQYELNGKAVFFEYDEAGVSHTFKGAQKEAIQRVMQGEKVRGFKKYEIK